MSGSTVAEMFYKADMLRDDFSGTEIRAAEDRAATIRDGKDHKGISAVVRMVVRR